MSEENRMGQFPSSQGKKSFKEKMNSVSTSHAGKRLRRVRAGEWYLNLAVQKLLVTSMHRQG